MERSKYFPLMLLILLSITVDAQTHHSIYQAYVGGDIEKWKRAMDSIGAARPETTHEIMELINYQYGYIAWCVGAKRSDEARKYLVRSAGLMTKLPDQKPVLSMVHAYKAAFAGFEIGLAPYKAPLLGYESLKFARSAIRLDSTNAFGYMQLGHIAFYTPRLMGGSKTEAMQYYLDALRLFESQPGSIQQNWNYLNLLITLIGACQDAGQYEQARTYCLKALGVEPEFDWVKNQLYPQILKKL